jgi:glycosyltransferase involved in cell wall biosynthesis
MAAKPTVDVIIPVYNAELYIYEALSSIQKQTYPVNKIIIVDDGSTDKSQAEIQRFKNRTKVPVEYIRTQNMGPAHARNIGIKASTADYISIHDADDVALPNKIESQIDLVLKNPEILFVHANYIFTNAEGKHIETRKHNRNKGTPLEGDVSKSIYYKVEDISTPTALIKRSLFNEVGLFDESMRYAEDLDMWMRISKKTKFGYIPEVSLHMRRHETNTTNSSRMFAAMFTFYNRWLSEFPDDSPTTLGLKRYLPYRALLSSGDRLNIKTKLDKKIQDRLLPFGNIYLAILVRIPYWIGKAIQRLFSSRNYLP